VHSYVADSGVDWLDWDDRDDGDDEEPPIP